MSELGDLLLEQVERVLADHADVAVLRGVERGDWPAALWAECEGLGLPPAMAAEAAGGAGLGFAEAGAVWRALGCHGAPVPLGEAMLAAALLTAAGHTLPERGPLLLAVGGVAPWGRAAGALVVADAARVALQAVPAELAHGANLAGEPRDAVVAPNTDAAGPGQFGLALLRACQIAGALEAVLAMTVEYANTRKQFGRAIGGFQAVQQQLAVAASETAAAGVAAAHACRAADRHGLEGASFEIACAKVVAGEAAGTAAAIAHQVHAAIGVTQEHALHLFTRRLWAWRDEGGSERYWARQLGDAAIGQGGAALWPALTARGEAEA